MIGKFHNHRRIIRILLSPMLTLLLVACCPFFPGPEATPTPTPTPVIQGGSHPPEELKISCPEEQSLFSLWYSHLAVIDVDAGDGETFYLKHESEPNTYFDLWIYPDGSISNEGIFREVEIPYHGTATHPNDDDCPVQTFNGTWLLRATITGTCKKNTAKIHITEEWVDPVLKSDCGEAVGPGPGLYSAPETDLVFNLNDKNPHDYIEIPEGSLFHAYYGYYLWPAGYDLPIVPLVPEKYSD
jgi:hypothetical protein